MPCNFDPKQIKEHDIFIETGTYTGKTIEKLKDKYKEYHTVEIVEAFHTKTKKLFEGSDNVKFYLGNSPVVLKYILASIDEPVTFWLDAHYQGGQQPGDTHAPIKSELKVIKEHHINTHMIMIDDVRLFRNYGTSVEEVTRLLKDINPEYVVEFFPGVTPTDVIVAYIK